MINSPVKIQGRKAKILPWVLKHIPRDLDVYVEPFLGSGTVAFNVEARRYVLADNNPDIIALFEDIRTLRYTGADLRSDFQNLAKIFPGKGADAYYNLRDRHNANPTSRTFMLLNRTCFNGLMRYNAKGGFNVPYCKDNYRLTDSLIDTLSETVDSVAAFLGSRNVELLCQPFQKTLEDTDGFVYADPPYLGSTGDAQYYTRWTEDAERELAKYLSVHAFAMSNWSRNPLLDTLWGSYTRHIREHDHIVGGSATRRSPVQEVIVTNTCL